jgi:hypothetical protein
MDRWIAVHWDASGEESVPYRYVGPFDSADDANTYASNHVWMDVVSLEAPPDA